MYICKSCEKKEKEDESCTYVHFGGSYGNCELCGKTALCVDCNCHKQLEQT